MKNYTYIKRLTALLSIAALLTAAPAFAAKRKAPLASVAVFSSAQPASDSIATSSATTTEASSTVVARVLPPPADNPPPENVYLLSNHLTAQQTQDALALAAGLGVAGLLLAQQDTLWRLYTLRSRRKAPVGLQSGSQA